MSDLTPEERESMETRTFLDTYDGVFPAVLRMFRVYRYTIYSLDKDAGIIETHWEYNPPAMHQFAYGGSRRRACVRISEVEPNHTRVNLQLSTEVWDGYDWVIYEPPAAEIWEAYDTYFATIGEELG